jgi:quercetin dioxygenase-like cupin family protein
MQPETLIKNLPRAEALELAGLVEYQDGQVVSRTLAQNEFLSLTLFAFAQGEGISAHTVPADALVYVLDGAAKVTIGDTAHQLGTGEAIVMPEGEPHALDAEQPFKMLLTVVKRPQPKEMLA